MANREEVEFLSLFSDTIDLPTVTEDEDEDSLKQNPSTKPSDELDININDVFSKSDTSEDEEPESKELEEDQSTEKPSESPVPDSTKDTNNSPTLLFAKYLSERGHLTTFDESEFLKTLEEKGEEDALADLWNNEAEHIRNNLLETYQEDVREYMEALDSGVDKNTAKDLVSTKKFFQEIDKSVIEEDDKEDLRKQILSHRYKITTNFDDKKIAKLVDRAVSLGEDVEEAQEALDELVQYYDTAIKTEKQNALKAEEDNRTKAQEELTSLKNKVKELKEIVPGITLTPKEKEKIIDKLTKPVKEVNGVPLNAIWAKRQEDPFKFDTVIAALDEIGVFDGKWDKLIKKGKSKIVDDLKRSINSNTSFKTSVGNVPNAFGEETQDALESMKAALRF